MSRRAIINRDADGFYGEREKTPEVTIPRRKGRGSDDRRTRRDKSQKGQSALRAKPIQSASAPGKSDTIAFCNRLVLITAAPAHTPINPFPERHTSCRHTPSLRTRLCTSSSPK